MATRLRFQLTVNGAVVTFSSISDNGIVRSVDGPDLFGRAVTFDLQPFGGTDFEQRFRDILAERGLASVQLKPAVDQGDLVFDADTDIPALPYNVRLGIEGFFDLTGSRRVDVDETPEDVRVPIALKSPEIQLTADPDAFEGKVRRLVMAPLSKIDGMAAADWLRRTEVDPQRKACVLNLLAKLRCVPDTDRPLIDDIDHIIAVQLERMYVNVNPAIISPSGPLEARHVNDEAFNDKQPPTSPTHNLLKLWIFERLQPPEMGVYDLKSYRENVTTDSLQVVVATPKSGQVGGMYADCDIDLGNPLTDAVGLAIHVQELASDNVTNHLSLYNDLSKDSTLKHFLYYCLSSQQ